MIYAKIPCQNGIPTTSKRIISAVSISDTQAIACIDTDSAEDDWEIISESDYVAVAGGGASNMPAQPPDISQLIGQFIVQQTLKNAELEQAINAIGAGIVQLQLKGGA